MACPKITAMLGIKNEERWIAKTLESLEEICDSIVILDDGSEVMQGLLVIPSANLKSSSSDVKIYIKGKNNR